jgi:hypothetical protein
MARSVYPLLDAGAFATRTVAVATYKRILRIKLMAVNAMCLYSINRGMP